MLKILLVLRFSKVNELSLHQLKGKDIQIR